MRDLWKDPSLRRYVSWGNKPKDFGVPDILSLTPGTKFRDGVVGRQVGGWVDEKEVRKGGREKGNEGKREEERKV